MNDLDSVKFLEFIGVPFAQKALDLIKKVGCLTLGFGVAVAPAAGSAIAASRSLNQSASTSALMSSHASPKPSGSQTAITMLVSIGAVTLTAAGLCMIAKTKLQNYMDSHSTYISAINSLTPEQRVSFNKHANFILKLEDIIVEDATDSPYYT